MNPKNNILLAFYGDDFTGSTDALEFLGRAGANAVLFIAPPTAEQLAAYPNLDAFGVAGLTRSMNPVEMEETLTQAFSSLKKTGARHVHYKTCSTFDSSPLIGSIGKAIDVGAQVFDHAYIPLLVAAPVLGRYCLFGNLFARMGIGSNGDIYRLDRHPSMSIHPVTPADESDLRLHLAKQTTKKTGLLDVLQLSKSKDDIQAAMKDLVYQGAKIILIDALYQEQLLLIGELIDDEANEDKSLFSVGSSGIEMSLGQYWNEKKVIEPVDNWPAPGETAQLLVVSGSCSPVTAVQIEWSRKNFFAELILNTEQIAGNDPTYVDAIVREAIVLLSGKNKGLVIHTNGAAHKPEINIPAENLGTFLGTITKQIVAATGIKRIMIAGGDTSSYAARAMGIESVRMIAPMVPGAPLCIATAPGSPLHKKEINFKGGQVGGEGYFGIVRKGGDGGY